MMGRLQFYNAVQALGIFVAFLGLVGVFNIMIWTDPTDEAAKSAMRIAVTALFNGIILAGASYALATLEDD